MYEHVDISIGWEKDTSGCSKGLSGCHMGATSDCGINTLGYGMNNSGLAGSKLGATSDCDINRP